MRRVWKTPELDYYNLYADMLQQPHLLIAGATGSGKSVVINGMMTTALKDSPAAVQFILIDPKRVELVDYRELPHTLHYSSEPGEMVQALQAAIAITDNRYRVFAFVTDSSSRSHFSSRYCNTRSLSFSYCLTTFCIFADIFKPNLLYLK